MPWYRQYVVNDETDGDNPAGAGGGGESKGNNEGDKPAEDAGTGGAAPEKDMASAIDAALGYKPGVDGKPEAKDDEAAAAAAAEKKAAAEKAAEDKARVELEAKAKAGDADAQRQIKEKQAADAKAKAAADAKPKDLKALELTAEEKKAIGAKTQARFNEVLGIAKSERERAERLEGDNKSLAAARDGILNVLKETNTSDDDLVGLLEYNRLTKSRDPKDLETALAVVEQQRASLQKALGKAGDGQDPLAAHPDLAKEVEDLKLTRERALEIAESRRQNALAKRSAEQARVSERAQADEREKSEKARNAALTDIEAWATKTAASDLDYKAKETKVLAAIESVIKEYPPNLWLPTIKRLYEAIAVEKAAPAVPAKEQQPLRPSGAKPGAPAPTSMNEAIDQALGYAKT